MTYDSSKSEAHLKTQTCSYHALKLLEMKVND